MRAVLTVFQSILHLVTVAFADSNLGRAVFTDSNRLGTAPRSIEKHIHQTIKLAQYNHVSFRLLFVRKAIYIYVQIYE